MEKEIRRNKHWFKDLMYACWNVLNFSRRVFLNIVFLFIAAIILLVFSASKQQPIIEVADNSILKLKISGTIVEEKTFIDPYSEFLADAIGENESEPEILLSDILDTLSYAQHDDKIQAVLLDLHGLMGGGLSKLKEVANAINQYKTSGKPILVYGDYFSQSQYYLAAHTDEVILNPMGAIGVDGFGRYRMYYKEALEKLKVNAHIFKVGTFKSAIEPYIRDDMSEAAKTANKQWLGSLWQQYKDDVIKARENATANTTPVFAETFDSFLTSFKQSKGRFSDFALSNNWADKLMTHQEFDQYLDTEIATTKGRFISNKKYLLSKRQAEIPPKQDQVAVIVARGTIYDGNRNPGEIGGNSTAKLLKMARINKHVKAVVIRVDSPGGSAFASEVIRNEVEAIKAAGKPVVVSMSSVAASGGYWISASADEIWASPATITGSIGIYGMFMTFEESLATIGINTDGVGTTEMAGLSATQTLNPAMAEVIQLAIENGYNQFINLVADTRNMSYQDVDKIAQGRVWSGQTAFELGLVDHLGYFSDAIESAATLANLTDYRVSYIKQSLSPFEKMMKDIFQSSLVQEHLPTTQKENSLNQILKTVFSDLSSLTKMNDPMGMYMHCLECKY